MRSIASDTVWVEIMVESNKKIVLGGVYRSPNNTVENNNVLWTRVGKKTAFFVINRKTPFFLV